MERNHTHTGGRHGWLWLSCVLLGLLAVSDFSSLTTSLASLAGTATQMADEATLVVADLLVDLACIALTAVCVRRATTVSRMQDDDTHDYVATSQLCVIALMGLTAVGWSVSTIVRDEFGPADLIKLLASLLPGFFYYAAVAREGHSQFWKGIKVAPVDEMPPRTGPLPSRLTISVTTGLLVERPLQGLDGIAVNICGSKDFVNLQEGANLGRHAGRLLAHDSRTAVYPLDEAVLGTLYVPEEKIALTGPALGGAARLGFYIEQDALTLIADDDPTRELLAWYVSRQYLKKHEASDVILELSELLIEDDAENLSELEDRIDRLEESMSDGVSEIPRDFSDYVNDTRHDLGQVQKFYRQLADAAEDALADHVLVSKRGRHLLAGLEHRASSLAADAQELRDYLNQVREGYQERIDVRQNGIMSILTIVTSISTPVALITGWYGMNFDNMAELHYSNAYGVIIILAVLIVTAEVFWFKHKRWF